MSEDILKILSNRESEPGIILFHESRQPRLVLSNNAEDSVIVPHDLLPESCQNENGMVDAVGVVRYLVQTIRKLETENQTLQKQIQELEKALIELVKIEVRLPECAVCWERGQCTDRSHGDDCLAIGFIINTAKEAAKE